MDLLHKLWHSIIVLLCYALNSLLVPLLHRPTPQLVHKKRRYFLKTRFEGHNRYSHEQVFEAQSDYNQLQAEQREI